KSDETESELLMNKGVNEVSLPMNSAHIYKTNSSHSLSDGCTENVDIVWHNVKYVVQTKTFRKAKSRTIELIRNASGRASGGKVTAILGPSGSGKTTLLESIAGLRTIGLSGDIYVTGGPKTKIAFCPQRDYHLEELSVWETLMFASKLK